MAPLKLRGTGLETCATFVRRDELWDRQSCLQPAFEPTPPWTCKPDQPAGKPAAAKIGCPPRHPKSPNSSEGLQASRAACIPFDSKSPIKATGASRP
jgi:hypothetical protein